MTKWEVFDKLPRPLLRYAGFLGACWMMFGVDIFSIPMDTATRGAVFSFITLIYGIRGWEKIQSDRIFSGNIPKDVGNTRSRDTSPVSYNSDNPQPERYGGGQSGSRTSGATGRESERNYQNYGEGE